MLTTLIIDYDAIETYIAEENTRNPNRTHTFFDLLLENTKTVLAWVVQGSEDTTRSIWIQLDESKKEATIFGEPIELPENKTLITLTSMKDKPVKEQLWLLFTELEDYAKRTEQYDRFFRVVEVSEEQRARQV